MRQLVTFDTSQLAQRLAAYLVTEGISAVAEEDPPGWAVWVREEDQLAQANSELKDFQTNPNDPKYIAAEHKAEAMRREARQRQQKQQRHVVEMRDRWSRNAMQGPRPLTVTILVLCSLISVLTNFSENILSADPLNKVASALLLMDPVHLYRYDNGTGSRTPKTDLDLDSLSVRFQDVLRGQVWRIITPAFVHYGVMHLVMNMWTAWILGSPIERRYGTVWYGILIILIAIPSTVSGSLVPLAWGGSPFGAGYSGVLFGFVGYMWVRAQYEPASGFYMPPSTLIFVGVYMIFGISRLDEQFFGVSLDNWGHGIGLVSGVAIGYVQHLVGLRSR